jgi:hypothetical protein
MPVGVPPLAVTVAVNVTGCPGVLGLREEVSVVTVVRAPTVRVAVAVALFGAWMDVTADVVLTFTPPVVPVTLSDTVHELPAGNVPLVSE